MVLFYISGISLVFKWTTQHWYTIISASSHQVNVMLKITQTMPLWNIHHRFCNLNLFCIRIEIWRMKEKSMKMNVRWLHTLKQIHGEYMKFVVELTVCGCETGTPTVRVIKLIAITMKTATIDQTFIFLNFSLCF